MKLTEEVKQKVQSLKRKFGNNCVIIYQKDADALFAIIDDWLSAVPETEALTDEQMRLMAHEVIDFNGGITDGVINMLQRHFSRRPAPAPEPAPQQDDAAVVEDKADLSDVLDRLEPSRMGASIESVKAALFVAYHRGGRGMVPRTEGTFTLEQVEKAIITEGDGRIVNDGRTATDEWWRGFARWTCARLTAAPEPTNQEPA